MKRFYLIPISLFVLDRINKYFAPSIDFGGGFLNFGLYKNYAGAFSLPVAGGLYNAAGIILLIIFGYLFFKEIKVLSSRAKPGDLTLSKGQADEISPRPRIEYGVGRNDKASAYLFIILGGASNLFDRLYYGYTIDYINFLNISFFNIADGMLIGGIVLLLIYKKKMPPQNSKFQMPNSK